MMMSWSDLRNNPTCGMNSIAFIANVQARSNLVGDGKYPTSTAS